MHSFGHNPRKFASQDRRLTRFKRWRLWRFDWILIWIASMDGQVFWKGDPTREGRSFGISSSDSGGDEMLGILLRWWIAMDH